MNLSRVRKLATHQLVGFFGLFHCNGHVALAFAQILQLLLALAPARLVLLDVARQPLVVPLQLLNPLCLLLVQLACDTAAGRQQPRRRWRTSSARAVEGL